MRERLLVQGSGGRTREYSLTLSGLLARRCNFEGADSIAQRRSLRNGLKLSKAQWVGKSRLLCRLGTRSRRSSERVVGSGQNSDGSLGGYGKEKDTPALRIVNGGILTGCKARKIKNEVSLAGSRTPLSRVTGGCTSRYTTRDLNTVDLDRN